MSNEVEYAQTLVREAARRYLGEHCSTAVLREHLELGRPADPVRDSRAATAELGWASILRPEPGDGLADTDRVTILSTLAQELGGALHPGAALASAVVGHAVATRGQDELRAAYLDPITDGTMTAAAAVHSGPGEERVLAEPSTTGVVLSGAVSPVPNGTDADLLLVAAGSPRGRLHILVPTTQPGVAVTPLHSLDLTRPFAHIELTSVTVPDSAVLASDPDRNRATEDLLTLMACAQSIGTAQRAFDITVDYAKTRIAFGRPIGAFQVIKHRLVDMLLVLESAKGALDAALADWGTDSDWFRDGAAIVKLYTAARLRALVRDCLQIHGGIGFTWEHDIHLYLRRIETDAALWPGVDTLTDRLARELGLMDRRDRVAVVTR